MIAFFNGKYIEKDQIRIDPDDRGFLFADGIYEAMRTYNGTLFQAEMHARRLHCGARAMGFDLAQVPDIIAIADELLDRNNLRTGGDALAYIQITRGVAPRNHAFPPKETPLTVYANVRPIPDKSEMREKGIAVLTVPDRRWARCDIKSVALLPNTMAHQQALEAGAEEAIMVRDGAAQEGSHSNAFIVQNGVVKTPPLTNYVLAGITRRFVLGLCEQNNVPYKETPVFLEDLHRADEAFVTGTTLEITPIVCVDGRTIGDGKPGAITRKLQEAFQKQKN